MTSNFNNNSSFLMQFYAGKKFVSERKNLGKRNLIILKFHLDCRMYKPQRKIVQKNSPMNRSVATTDDLSFLSDKKTKFTNSIIDPIV